MAKQRRSNAAKKRPLTLFFLNGKLHRKLRIVRPEDKIETWCYPEHRRVVYTYSDVKRNYEPAFSTAEVAEMMGRNKKYVSKIVTDGCIEPPQMMYTMTAKKHPYGYRWSEQDIVNLHAYLMTVHRGRPRADGKTTPSADIPTLRELRAMIRQEQIFYVKNENGEFVPTWRAGDFS